MIQSLIRRKTRTLVGHKHSTITSDNHLLKCHQSTNMKNNNSYGLFQKYTVIIDPHSALLVDLIIIRLLYQIDLNIFIYLTWNDKWDEIFRGVAPLFHLTLKRMKTTRLVLHDRLRIYTHIKPYAVQKMNTKFQK